MREGRETMICPVCRGTMRWNNGRFACPVCGYDDTPKLKLITNADRIRSMTDEELAEWIEQLETPKCPCDDWFYRCEKWNCNGCWLDWLKQEAITDG